MALAQIRAREDSSFLNASEAVGDAVARKKRKLAVSRKELLQRELLYGEKGVKKLIAQSESDVLKGSGVPGNELADLQRLMWVYRRWSNELCGPKKGSAELFHDMRDLNATRMHKALQDMVEGAAQEAAIKEIHANHPAPVQSVAVPSRRPVPFRPGMAAAAQNPPAPVPAPAAAVQPQPEPVMYNLEDFETADDYYADDIEDDPAYHM